MKAVLMSIQPYWAFLIIARLMGLDIPQAKTVEVRKNFPQDSAWSRKTLIYCSKAMGSFKRIPEQYQQFMRKLMGKVIGEFVCDRIEEIKPFGLEDPIEFEKQTCMRMTEIVRYLGGLYGYGWHISDLKIYDKPKELGEFRKPCPAKNQNSCLGCKYQEYEHLHPMCHDKLTRPPQSWCYVEEL